MIDDHVLITGAGQRKNKIRAHAAPRTSSDYTHNHALFPYRRVFSYWIQPHLSTLLYSTLLTLLYSLFFPRLILSQALPVCPSILYTNTDSQILKLLRGSYLKLANMPDEQSWTSKKYNEYYNAYVPWLEDKYLAWFGENKTSYTTKGASSSCP